MKQGNTFEAKSIDAGNEMIKRPYIRPSYEKKSDMFKDTGSIWTYTYYYSYYY